MIHPSSHLDTSAGTAGPGESATEFPIELTEAELAQVSGAGLGDLWRKIRNAVAETIRNPGPVTHNNGLTSEWGN